MDPPAVGLESVQTKSGGSGVNARRAALEVLRAADARGTRVDEALAARIGQVPEADRGLLTQLVHGSTRHRRTLDHLIRVFSGQGLRRIDPCLRWILRLGIFQVAYLDRIPDFAACSESVDLAKRTGRKGAGFVNAVLRGVVRGIAARGAEGGAPARFLRTAGGRGIRFVKDVFPSEGQNPVASLGIRESYPDWLVRRWIRNYGLDGARGICRSGNAAMPLSARVLRDGPGREGVIRSLGEQGIRAVPGEREDSLWIESPGDLERLSAFRNGWIQIQDESAMRAAGCVPAAGSGWILDACASPGGKTAQLADVPRGGSIVACDLTLAKALRLRETCRRLRLERVHVVVADARWSPFRRRIDAALLDVPCTNTGVLARRSDARWRIRPRDLVRLPALQRAILRRTVSVLKPGGTLVYSTCSIEPEENEQVVQDLLREASGGRLAGSELWLPSEKAGGGFVARIVVP